MRNGFQGILSRTAWKQANIAPERKGKGNSVSFASDTFLERTGMREREK